MRSRIRVVERRNKNSTIGKNILVKQIYLFDVKKFFEPITKTVAHTSRKRSRKTNTGKKTFTEKKDVIIMDENCWKNSRLIDKEVQGDLEKITMKQLDRENFPKADFDKGVVKKSWMNKKSKITKTFNFQRMQVSAI